MHRAVPILLVLTCSGACQRDSGEELGLGTRGGDTKLPVAKQSLERLLSPSATHLDHELGSYQRTQTVKLVMNEAERSDTLEETWRNAVDPLGNLHGLHATSRDPGLEWYFVDGNFYVKLAYGRFLKRDPQGDEIERLRNAQARVLASYLAVLGRFIARSDEGETKVLGRPAITVRLALAPHPGDPAPDELAWRKTLQVSKLAGVLQIDLASGALLDANLDASYSFRRGAQQIGVSLAYKSTMSVIASAPRLAAPADTQPAPSRARPLLERAALLDGLAAPTRNATPH